MQNKICKVFSNKFMSPVYLIVAAIVVAYACTGSPNKSQQPKMKIKFQTAETEQSGKLTEYTVEKSDKKFIP